MINAVVKDLLDKKDWSRIIFRFPTSSYTLFNSEKYEIDSFCLYIHDNGIDGKPETMLRKSQLKVIGNKFNKKGGKQ